MNGNKIFIFFFGLLTFVLIVKALSVFGADAGEAQSAYLEADKLVGEMQEKGYPTLPLLDMLDTAEQNYNLGNYNITLAISRQIISDSQRISSLQEKLLAMSDESRILGIYGQDVENLDLQLLYAKSDFEAANIDLAEREAGEVEKMLREISANYSEKSYESLLEYKKKLEERNMSENFFDKYLQGQEDFYARKDYYHFLKGFLYFEAVTKIIDNKQELLQNLQAMHEQNMGFERLQDTTPLIETYLNASDYDSALKELEKLNLMLTDAIELKKEIPQIESEYKRIEELGIIDNRTSEIYYSFLKEFELENYEGAKNLSEDVKKSLRDIETKNIIFGGIKKASLKKGLKEFFIKNWLYILILILTAVIAYRPLSAYFFILYSKSAIRKCGAEKDAILALQKELQKQYYIDHDIDKKTYHSDFSRHEERNVELANRITFLDEKSKSRKEYLNALKKSLKTALLKSKRETKK